MEKLLITSKFFLLPNCFHLYSIIILLFIGTFRRNVFEVDCCGFVEFGKGLTNTFTVTISGFMQWSRNLYSHLFCCPFAQGKDMWQFRLFMISVLLYAFYKLREMFSLTNNKHVAQLLVMFLFHCEQIITQEFDLLM